MSLLDFLKAWRAVGALAVIAAAAVVTAAPAEAAAFTVTNLDDSGAGSLRQAILDANDAPGADTIGFGVSGTITLTSGQLTVTDDLTINGPGAANLTISGGGTDRILTISAVTIELSAVTLADGFASFGGAIRNFGTLTLTDTGFSGNSSGVPGGAGGAITNSGTVTVTDSTFSSNSGGNVGGGISNTGTLAVTNSTFADNTAINGGAIGDFGGTVTLTNSTFAGNAASLGGAIFEGDGTLTVTNSTFSANSAATGGAMLTTNSSTVVLRNNVVANSPSGTNCVLFGFVTDGGGNLSWPDSTCPGINADPMLGPLADNGGPTRTMALAAESPAIDAAVAANCPATDQRGVARPQGAGCDSGAFEAVTSPVALVESVLAEIEELIGDNPGSPLADKAEDARDKLVAALVELGKTPPDGAAALGNLEGAAGDLEAAVAQGLLSEIEGEELMDALAQAARLVAVEAIDDAAGGDPAKIAEAEQALADGDTLRDDGRFKNAVGKYKDAFSKAESA